MEKSDQAIASLIEKLQELGVDHVPGIIEGALRAIYLEGLIAIVASIVLYLICGGALMMVIQGVKKDCQELAIPGILLTFITGIAASIGMFSESAWIKLLDAEAYLYLSVLRGMT